jgi:hypothetical protein
LVGESGVNGYIYQRHSQTDDAGWGKYDISAQAFAGQVKEYIEGCDTRVQGVLLYMTDYHDEQWESFDTLPAHGELLRIASAKPLQPSPFARPTQPTGDTWQRSLDFVFKWEGELSLDPNDSGNYYQGKLIGTKYGISAASWGGQYDIPNLTREQAQDIYFKHYWQASGADKLAWPLCLLVFDTAVLHGVGAAVAFAHESGPDPYAFAAKRLRIYVESSKWVHFGNAWVRRVADLLEAMT